MSQTVRTTQDDLERASGISSKTLYGAELVVDLMTHITTPALHPPALSDLEYRLQLLEALHESTAHDNGESPVDNPLRSDLERAELLEPVRELYQESMMLLVQYQSRLSPTLLGRLEKLVGSQIPF